MYYEKTTHMLYKFIITRISTTTNASVNTVHLKSYKYNKYVSFV